MKTIRSLIGLSLIALAPVVMFSQVSVAVENYLVQTGAATTTYQGSVFYATVEGVAGVTSATVSASSGDLTTPANLPDQGDFLEYEDEEPMLATILSRYPLNTTYTITTAGIVDSVAITAPNATFPSIAPTRPLFTISGVSGTWVGNTFQFNANSVSSFTITLNNYAVTNPGGYYGYYLDVNGSGGFEDGVGGGPMADAVPYTAPTFTFTSGLVADAGDGDSTTYGITNGTTYYLEAGYFNAINWQTAAFHGADVGFVAGAVTGFNLQAIPEPSTYAAIFGALALAGVVVHRRRRAAC